MEDILSRVKRFLRRFNETRVFAFRLFHRDLDGLFATNRGASAHQQPSSLMLNRASLGSS